MPRSNVKIPINASLAFVFFLSMAVVFGSQEATSILDSFFSPLSIETVAQATPSPTVLGSQGSITSSMYYPVVGVVDGDTIKVEIEGQTETVRVVGINTPETVDSRKAVECFGAEASAQMRQLVSGQKVRLEADPTQSDRDRYQRLLRFVFLGDDRDVGLQLIRDGYAYESLYSSKPHKYHAAYIAAQSEAQQQQRGLWSPDVCVRN